MYRFIVLYVCIYVAPWSCEARHFVPLYVPTCSGMTIKLNLTWLDLFFVIVFPKKQTFATEKKMPPPRVNKKPRNESTTKDNMGTHDDPLKFLDQDYQELKKSCITNQKRFVDDKFPPDSSSIDPKKILELDLDQIEWLRPSVSYLYSLPSSDLQ